MNSLEIWGWTFGGLGILLLIFSILIIISRLHAQHLKDKKELEEKDDSKYHRD